MKRKLTELGVENLKAPKSGRLEVWDSVLPAFGLRVTEKNARSWIVALRRPGAKHPSRIKLGAPPDMSLAAARAKARQMMEGGAPERPVTFKVLAGQFLEHGHTKRGRTLRPATLKEYRRALLTYGTALHAKPVREIRRGEIAGLIREVANTRGSTSAMRTRAALSRFWGWMLASDLVDANVVVGTEGYSTPKRQRVLADGELRALWAATADRSDFNLIVRLCLWLGCRRAEAGGMAEGELDAKGIWTVPGERTKNHRPLVLPLPCQARNALDAWPRVEGRKLLFGRLLQKKGEEEARERGYQGWSQAKSRLDALITSARAERRLGRPLTEDEEPAKEDALPSWDLHDLRRTVETRMSGLRIPKDHVNKVLNHAAGPITEAYDLHSYLPEKATFETAMEFAVSLARAPSGHAGGAARPRACSHERHPRGGRGFKTELRRQVASAGLGQRLANSWRDWPYPNQELDAASLVYEGAQMIHAFR